MRPPLIEIKNQLVDHVLAHFSSYESLILETYKIWYDNRFKLSDLQFNFLQPHQHATMSLMIQDFFVM